jgi:hypothetical protein
MVSDMESFSPVDRDMRLFDPTNKSQTQEEAQESAAKKPAHKVAEANALQFSTPELGRPEYLGKQVRGKQSQRWNFVRAVKLASLMAMQRKELSPKWPISRTPQHPSGSTPTKRRTI